MATQTVERFGTLYSPAVVVKAKTHLVRPSAWPNQFWVVSAASWQTYQVSLNWNWNTDRGITWMSCSCKLRDHAAPLITYCSHGLAVRNFVGR